MYVHELCINKKINKRNIDKTRTLANRIQTEKYM
jgi:hypothetical protein